MNFGDCPYPDCSGSLEWAAVPDASPKFIRDACPDCQQVVWRKLSRLTPEAFTEQDFQNRYTVDEATKIITVREAAHG